MVPNRILIVEDDELIAELEKDYLEAGGFQAEVELNGNQGLKKALGGGYEALVLDVMLPGKNGFEICREVREVMNVPILLVTAKKEDVDKIRGLGLGADDYLVKPFSPMELVARVKSHIQMHQRLLEQKDREDLKGICVDGLEIYPKERKVLLERQVLSLTNKEFELLLFLAENPNIVFSKETLFDRVWEMDSAGTVATVTVHINRLREKIERDKENPRFIETVWGAGYRFRV